MITPEQARRELARRELARRELAKRDQSIDDAVNPSREFARTTDAMPQPPISEGEASVRATAQGITAGLSDELVAGLAAAPQGMYNVPGSRGTQPQQDYQRILGEERAANKQAEDLDPQMYKTRELLGGMLMPVPGGAAAKGASWIRRLLQGAGAGAAQGAINAAGHADTNDPGQFAEKTAEGGGIGAGFGAATSAVSGAGSWLSDKLKGASRNMQLNAAIGPGRAARKPLIVKDRVEAAKDYLDNMKLGATDTPDTIAEKLTKRQDELRGALDETVHTLEGASPQKQVSPELVARRVEDAAKSLNKRASRGRYKALMDEAAAIRENNQPLSFREAMEERQAAQAEANYNSESDKGRSAIFKQIARAWNDEIDDAAENVMKSNGREPLPYRKQREEFSLIQDLIDQSDSYLQGRESKDLSFNPADYVRPYLRSSLSKGAKTSSDILGTQTGIPEYLRRLATLKSTNE